MGIIPWANGIVFEIGCTTPDLAIDHPTWVRLIGDRRRCQKLVGKKV
jgi:hypothetical protein